ncbi:MAG: hypothetical protein ACOYB4_09865, partial [Methyloceanibacter sp.]
KDCIALVLAWALLLQSAILSFSFGLHASAFAAGPGEDIVLCSVRGEAPDGPLPVSHHQPDMACCILACRMACHAGVGGILAAEARVPLPGSAAILVEAPRHDAAQPHSAGLLTAQPRAPPLA